MIEIEKVRAIGGHLTHAKLKGQGRYGSLCGHFPASPTSTQMKPRSGWDRQDPDTVVTCKECLKKLEKMNGN